MMFSKFLEARNQASDFSNLLVLESYYGFALGSIDGEQNLGGIADATADLSLAE